VVEEVAMEEEWVVEEAEVAVEHRLRQTFCNLVPG
jgi:hypothetical protein